MKYHTIKTCDTVNGEGMRVSIFFAGCDLKCLGCFNEELWSENSGKEFTLDVFHELCELLKSPNIDGLSILGGEPLYWKEDMVEFCMSIKRAVPMKDIWFYSGHTKQWIEEHYPNLFKSIDVLVDGPFVKELADPNLVFKGSSNQHIYRKICHYSIKKDKRVCNFESYD